MTIILRQCLFCNKWFPTTKMEMVQARTGKSSPELEPIFWVCDKKCMDKLNEGIEGSTFHPKSKGGTRDEN